MIFLDELHKKNFWQVCSEDRHYDPNDKERTALFYIISGNEDLFSHRSRVYELKERAINAMAIRFGRKIL